MAIFDLARPTRRGFLFSAPGIVAVAGISATARAMTQTSPPSGIRDTDEILEIDVGKLQPGERIVEHWKGMPIFTVRRTDAMLTAMRRPSPQTILADADSFKRQQPSCATNWHRSIDPQISVLVGICTRCACVPEYFADETANNVAGGYICPCCASHFDAAGRAYAGITQFNLPVPPYRAASALTVLIGRNPSGEIFFFESIEKI
jgi:ubiquinol-cytochrome c reductase iron-sulfur subunit